MGLERHSRGGTKGFLRGPPLGEPLDVTGLAGISSYEPTELVVTVRAGTPCGFGKLRSRSTVNACRSNRRAFPGGTVEGWWRPVVGTGARHVGAVRDHVLG